MKLNTHVVCWDRMLRVHVFGPGDDLPEWAVKQITNPNVWVDTPEAAHVEVIAEPDGPEAFVSGDPERVPPLAIPPKKGPKATAGAWRDYALAAVERAGLNIDIPAEAGRGDIIDALTEAGIPTE